MSIVTCIFLYVALIGLLVAFFQPVWLVIPNETKFGCLNTTEDIVQELETTDKGSCGFSGMCYPMDHVKKVENMTCYPNMESEQCVWYDSLEKIGNSYDQACTLLFLVGLILCVIAWFYTMIGCCSLTCCCCNIYTFIASMLTIGATAILVAVLLWLGMMGEYKVTDQSCPNIFCGEIGPFDLGHCQIGWSGYLGIIFWFMLVALTIMSWFNAYQNRVEIKKVRDEEQLNPNESVRKASKVRVAHVFSNESAASVTTERNRNTMVIHGARNGFSSSASQFRGADVAWET